MLPHIPVSLPKPETCTPECWRDTNTLEVWHQKGCPTWPAGGHEPVTQ